MKTKITSGTSRLDEDDADVIVVADSAYGSGANLKALQDAGASTVIKAPRDTNSRGGFPGARCRSISPERRRRVLPG